MVSPEIGWQSSQKTSQARRAVHRLQELEVLAKCRNFLQNPQLTQSCRSGNRPGILRRMCCNENMLEGGLCMLYSFVVLPIVGTNVGLLCATCGGSPGMFWNLTVSDSLR